MAAKRKGSTRSLIDFARAKRREGCKVCALPDGLRRELKEARARKVPREIQMAWLTAEHGHRITNSDLDMHGSGRHDAD